jgi:hypothetical protein
MRHLKTLGLCVLTVLMTSHLLAETPYQTVLLSRLPESLQQQYKKIQPEFTDKSHCAAAWDSTSDGDKMAFRCSIFIKMSAEGERRAMRYCDEKREEHKIHSPCHLIVEN